MIHPHTELRFINETIGSGVFARRAISAGTLVWVRSELDPAYSVERMSRMSSACRAYVNRYAYIDQRGDYVLCIGDGKYVNHSCDPATLSFPPEFNLAVRDIEPGQEITCDYGVSALAAPLACQCGAANCRKTVLPDDPRRMLPQWNAALSRVLSLVRQVEQPLWPFLSNPEILDDLVNGRRNLQSHRRLFGASVS
jgi:uncharacterized protein